MSFLQPWMLAALPIAALPVIIHLINQRRFQTINWAAMRFVLEANRMSRGYARLRQWLILTFRVLAIAALIFVISRPLATGWIGLAGGGRPDTTLILVDRSASMMQQGAGTSSSKLETGIAQLTRTLETLGSARWVVIDSVTRAPVELKSPVELIQTASARPASSAADLPAMLQAAHDYIKNNHAGQTEIWICSDLRANDWNAESGRWQSLRDGFQEFKQSVRFHLLAYPDPAIGNMGVRVSGIERHPTAGGTELLVSVKLRREDGEGKLKVPLRFEIEGSRSELTVEMEGPEIEIKNHSIELSGDRKRGWGRVSIPADVNPADNEFYFVFDEPPPRHTILVAEDPQTARSLQLAAASSTDPAAKSDVDVIGPAQMAAANFDDVALLLWQAPLPGGESAVFVRDFVARGGRVIFFPPVVPDNKEIFGARWTSWTVPPEPIRVESWRGDQDLLAHTQSGAALPVGELTVRRYCGLAGEFTPLAKLYGGAPLLVRVTTDRGGVYFCSTTTSSADASLGVDGVALYVAVQRALEAGTAELSNARLLVAGDAFPDSKGNWQKLAGSDNSLSSEYSHHAGVYGDGARMLAVNRGEAEDRPAVLGDARIGDLFHGLVFDRVDDQAGNMRSLAREVWRVCIGGMLAAIVIEAALCLPKRRPQLGAAA